MFGDMNNSDPYGRGHVRIINVNIGDQRRPYDQDMAGEWVEPVVDNVTPLDTRMARRLSPEPTDYERAVKRIPITGAAIIDLTTRLQG